MRQVGIVAPCCGEVISFEIKIDTVKVYSKDSLQVTFYKVDVRHTCKETPQDAPEFSVREWAQQLDNLYRAGDVTGLLVLWNSIPEAWKEPVGLDVHVNTIRTINGLPPIARRD